MDYWIIMSGWILLIVIAVVIEIESFELISIWFALGAGAALVLFFLEFALIYQFGAFAIVSAISLFFIKRLMTRETHSEKTNIDSFKGKEVRVFKNFDEDGLGEVKLEGKIWTAKSIEKRQFKINDLVVIEAIEGNKIIVK